MEEKISFVRGRKGKKINAQLTTKNPQISDFTSDDNARSVTIGIDENGRDRGIKIGKGLGRAPAFDITFGKKDFGPDFHPTLTALANKSDELKERYDL